MYNDLLLLTLKESFLLYMPIAFVDVACECVLMSFPKERFLTFFVCVIGSYFSCILLIFLMRKILDLSKGFRKTTNQDNCFTYLSKFPIFEQIFLYIAYILSSFASSAFILFIIAIEMICPQKKNRKSFNLTPAIAIMIGVILHKALYLKRVLLLAI